MKCENCGKNIANVHYRSSYNGNVTEKHLCSECAEELGYNKEFFGEDMFSDFFDGFFGRDAFAGFGGLGGFGMMPLVMPTMMMPRLEIRYGDPEEKPEENAEEKPQEEAKADPEMSRRRELNALRSQLRKAVREERYEDAAKLRDEIKELEK